MSNFDDNQDYPKTLPSPELNPLTNPVLGRNMGRWAEVYFTTPPEKREQAVQELLRELERDSSAGQRSAQATAVPSDPGQGSTRPATSFSATSAATIPETAAATSRTAFGAPAPVAPLREEFIQCRSCGRLALVDQKFCGACGSPLPVRESVPDADPGNGASQLVPATAEPGQLEVAAEADPGKEEKLEEAVIREEKFVEPKIDQLPTPVESFDQDRALIWAQGVKPITDDVPRLFLEQQRARQRRSRLLTGAALAILVVTLFYVGARGTAAWLRAHDVAQNAAAKTDSAAVGAGDGSAAVRAGAGSSSLPVQTAKRGDVTPAVVVHAAQPAPAGLSAARQDDKKNPAEHNGSAAAVFRQKSDESAKAEDQKLNPAAADHGGHGAEELAIAESYLSATQGKTRDTSEAAQWLWKALGKQNAAAALLLSDLYVTGDGVPRNCDQARLLLDAAARKGVPGAGERIRDLPNLGCQ
ncbi:MAG: hypothetical protein WBQ08_03170 [Candidatus Sulfotelmatobacter sp.]